MFSHLRTPNFERLVITLFGGKADAVPLLELGIHPIMKSSILGREWLSLQDEVEFMTSMGYDYVKIQPGITFEVNRQKADRSAQAIHDPNTPDRAWSVEGKGVISSWEDFEKYEWPPLEGITYDRFDEARKLLPKGMGIIGQYGDIFTTAWELMGFENFGVAVYEQPDLIKALFDKVSERILSMYERMVEFPFVGALWYSDDIAYTNGLMMPPDFYREYFFPLLARIGTLARQRGIPLLYHSDGDLWSVMDDIVGAGVTSLHPIEPKGMDIRELKAKRGRQLCLCGGIEVDLLSRGTQDEVRELVRSYLRDIAPGGGWAAGSSNSIPEYVKKENYLAMVETVLKEGTYS